MKPTLKPHYFGHIITIPAIFFFGLLLILALPGIVDAQNKSVAAGPLTWGVSGTFAPNGVFPAKVISMQTDAQGTLHILGYYISPPDENDQLYYVQRTQAGVWLSTQRVDQDGQSILNPRMAVDGLGNVHVAWIEDVDPSPNVTDEMVMYNKRSTNGNWGTPEIISNAPPGQESIRSQSGISLATNQRGDVIISWVTQVTLGTQFYNYALVSRFKPVAGSWGEYELANSPYAESSTSGPNMKMDNNGNTYLFWLISPSSPNHGVYINTRSYGTGWGNLFPVTVNGQPVNYSYSMLMGSNGQVYALLSIGWAVWTSYIGNGAFHVVSNMPANPPEATSGCSGGSFYRNNRGDMLMAISCLVFPDRIYYSYAPLNGNWSSYSLLSHQTAYIEETSPIVTLTDTGVAYAIWTDTISSNNSAQVFAMSQPALANSAMRVNSPVAIPGATNRYTITLKNPMPFSMVYTVSDPLPAGITLVPGSITMSSGSVTSSNTHISWTGSIPVNVSPRLSFSVLVDETITGTVVFENEVTASVSPEDSTTLRVYTFANPQQSFLPLMRQ